MLPFRVAHPAQRAEDGIIVKAAFPPFVSAILVMGAIGAAAEPEEPASDPSATGAPQGHLIDRMTDMVATDDRVFLSYNPRGRSRWNSHFLPHLDLTGVSWDSPRTATAITPRHVVMAAHYPRHPGDSLVFHDRSGNRHSRKLLKTISLGSKPTWMDISVGLLDRPLPDEIKTYPLLAPSADYAGRLAGGHALVTNNRRRLLVREIRFVREKSLRLDYRPDEAKDKRQPLTKGDSGNPSFLLLDDGLVLVETHSLGNAGTGAFYSPPVVFAAITEAARKLDRNHTIRTARLDPRYSRIASARRADRAIYQFTRTDGSGMKAPKRSTPAPTASRRPSSSPTPREQATPRPKKVPRVRRVPRAPSPDP